MLTSVITSLSWATRDISYRVDKNVLHISESFAWVTHRDQSCLRRKKYQKSDWWRNCSGEEKFLRKRVIVYGYDDLWQADVIEMRPHIQFNKNYHYILTIIDVLSKYMWAVPLKIKSGNEMVRAIAKISQDDGRWPKNLQTNMGKEFYNNKHTEPLEKTWHQPLFDIFRNKSVSHRTVQSYIKEQHVETIYAQRKL